ncbi:MAG: helix-turn-helix domain-containing protein [bacterium]|nr:helix-turn-helix domain-containing protein [bacterium]
MEKLLEQFNFTEQEIRVYKALLQLGGATVSEIAEATGIKRTSCQEYIRSIEERGFINSSKIGNKFFYQAEDPDKFRQLVHERMYVVDHLLALLESEEKEEDWRVRSVTREEAGSLLGRAKKRIKNIVRVVRGGVELSFVADDKIIVSSTEGEIEGIEIVAPQIVSFHRDLLKGVY